MFYYGWLKLTQVAQYQVAFHLDKMNYNVYETLFTNEFYSDISRHKDNL